MYLENACCLFYAILHHSTVIQDNSIGLLCKGLLAGFPAILDSFFQVYHKCLYVGEEGGVVEGGIQLVKNFREVEDSQMAHLRPSGASNGTKCKQIYH